ncbi:MAG: hypothetical protein ACRCU1_16715, partial [Alsobacter sp.]
MTPARFVLRSISRAVLGVVASTAVAAGVMAQTAQPEARFITVSSTTSTQDSGLFGHLLPIFTAKTGIAV